MRIPAQLDLNPTDRGAGQVVRHERGGAPEEPERGRGHPTEADRDELGHSALVGRFKESNGVGSIGGWCEVSVTGAGHRPAQAPTPGPPRTLRTGRCFPRNAHSLVVSVPVPPEET
jgi:hypothetical protein